MIVLGMHFITFRSAGQMTMPDHVCTGHTRRYYVIPGVDTGSTYTWWVDGRVMSGFNSSEFNYTWTSSKIYLLEVQERSADGCPGPKKSGEVFVNPYPEIQVSASDSMICNGESVTVSVQNRSGLIWGKWLYDLIVEPEAGIIGNTISSTYTDPTDLNETLFNYDTVIHKVVYRFIPRIVTDDGVKACEGKDVKITLWIHPGLRYRKEVSYYNGFNISCYGLSNGYINIEPSSELAPFTFSWTNLGSFRATTEDISELNAGQYMMLIVDRNNCPTRDTFNLREPDKLCLIIPDAFSPNGDLVNDVWEIETTDFYPQIEIKIYNRWGQALWKSERGYPIPWDGRSRGEELPIDSYHYVIDLNDGSNPIIGTITIIR